MLELAVLLNILFVLFLFVIFIYVLFKQPSKIQLLLVLLMVSIIVMLIGYIIEIRYRADQDLSMIGVMIAYIGKPFSLLMGVLFVAEYCGKYPSKRVVIALAIFSTLMSLVVITNRFHHLYYSSTELDTTKDFSYLVLGHGPLYFVYMAYMGLSFLWITILIIKEAKKSKTKDAKSRVLLLILMATSVLLGYIIYLTGITGGYDTTMLGTGISVIFLAILFFKYDLFDYLLFARNSAINEASDGILVLNDRGDINYQNLTVSKLLKNQVFTLDELNTYSNDIHVAAKGEKYYRVKKDLVENKGKQFGYTFEISDITSEYNYANDLSIEVEKKTKNIKDIQERIIISFASMVEARDESTGDHIIRMSKNVEIIANDMLEHKIYPNILTEDYLKSLIKVSPLHDVGKIAISDAILCKPGKLTDEEFDTIKTHTTIGAKIVRDCFEGVETDEYVHQASDVALYHHEKWNGKGYPIGLSGTSIPLSARIVAIADVYDALVSKRCYKEAFSFEKAKDIILEERGSHFDPEVVDAFTRCLPKIESLYSK